MKVMRGLLFLMTIGLMTYGYAQNDIRGPISNPSPGVLDGVYVQEHIPTKKVVPYEFVREADVTWSKRVWRVIDLREKFNHPLYYPLDEIDVAQGFWFKNTTRWSLWTIIRHHVLTGDLTLYSPYHPIAFNQKDGDLFKYPITSENPGGNYFNDKKLRKKMVEYLAELGPESDVALTNYLGYDSVIRLPNGLDSTVYPPRDTFFFKSSDIIAYKLKEDWFFDKERSVLDVRIIGIAPMRYSKDRSTGAISGMQEMFWLYFPECRYVFQGFFVQNRNNDAQRMSFDDLFWKRKFQSYIDKESNLYDRDIESYKAGVDALLESERIKEKIFTFEHDLWSF